MVALSVVDSFGVVVDLFVTDVDVSCFGVGDLGGGVVGFGVGGGLGILSTFGNAERSGTGIEEIFVVLGVCGAAGARQYFEIYAL